MDSQQRHRALITGASSGIGKATALAFAQAGVDLVLVSRSHDNLMAVAEEARSHAVDVQVYPMDLMEVAHIASKIDAIAQQGPPITILVNNAGMGYTNTLMDTPLADWQAVMTLNVTSVFQCIQGILPSMRDRQQGTIINVGSIAGHQAFPGWAAYNVSKAGLIALSKTLAAEERSHGIRVSLITPGAVNTPIWDTDTVQAEFNRASMLTPEVVADAIVHAALAPAYAVIDELVVMPSAGAL
jgi:short-subunit dehydrogenase